MTHFDNKLSPSPRPCSAAGMGGATRIITLLSIPLPSLRTSFLRCRLCISTLSSFPLPSLALTSHSRTKFRAHRLVKSFHSQPNNYSYGLDSSAAQQQRNHPWPEWSNFVRILSNRQELCVTQDNRIPPEDAFVVYEELPDDFVRSASSCLAFARARPNLLGYVASPPFFCLLFYRIIQRFNLPFSCLGPCWKDCTLSSFCIDL